MWEFVTMPRYVDQNDEPYGAEQERLIFFFFSKLRINPRISMAATTVSQVLQALYSKLLGS